MDDGLEVKRRQFTAAACVACAAYVLGLGRAVTRQADAAEGVRLALERGALAAVALLGRHDGFPGNPQLRILVPRALNWV